MPAIMSSDGVRLHAVDEGEGPAVVLVGGFLMAATGWGAVRPALREAGYRVVAVDRRSHGEAAHTPHGQTLARHAQDVAEVLEGLDVRDATWVGASMGASTAWAHLAEHGVGRLRAIASVDQTPAMLPAAGWDLGMTGLDADRLDAFVAGFPGALNPLHRMPPAELLAAMRPPTPAPMDDLRGLLREHCEADWRPTIAACRVPVLAVAGRQSPFWPWQHAEAVADLAAGGRAVILEDCGHVPPVEQPGALVAALLHFLDEVYASGSEPSAATAPATPRSTSDA